jgi:hypothetical protein
MATVTKSFHIYDIIYDDVTKKLTYNFEVNGLKHQKVCIDYNTPDKIAESVKSILQRYYVVESEL